MDLQIRGTDQLVDLSRALKGADKALTKELFRGIQRSTKKIRADMKDAARNDLPRAGGLNELVAASRFSTRTRRSGRSPGVRIVVGGKQVRDVRSIDRGRLRHPVYGTTTWVNQSIPPGVFSIPFEKAAPAVRRQLVESMDDVARKIARSAQ